MSMGNLSSKYGRFARAHKENQVSRGSDESNKKCESNKINLEACRQPRSSRGTAARPAQPAVGRDKPTAGSLRSLSTSKVEM